MSIIVHSKVLAAPTQQQVWDANPGQESYQTRILELSAGCVSAVIERVDFWENGQVEPPYLSAGIDWPHSIGGSHNLEIYEDDPGTVESLPALCAVLTEVHRYFAKHQRGSTE